MSNTTTTLANAIQLSSDTLVEVLGPDIAHSVDGESITAASLKSLIKAELVSQYKSEEQANV